MTNNTNEGLRKVYENYKHLDGPLSLNPPWKQDLPFEMKALSEMWEVIKEWNLHHIVDTNEKVCTCSNDKHARTVRMICLCTRCGGKVSESRTLEQKERK